jgi:hypothetical protein
MVKYNTDRFISRSTFKAVVCFEIVNSSKIVKTMIKYNTDRFISRSTCKALVCFEIVKYKLFLFSNLLQEDQLSIIQIMVEQQKSIR